MNNTTRMNDLQGLTPVGQHKDWTKPVLDILELESAESLIGKPGGDIKQRAGSH